MTDLVYLKDSYKKSLKTKIVSIEKRGEIYEIVLESTIFYPQSGGQPSDNGIIVGKKGTAHVKHVRMQDAQVVHECTVSGILDKGNIVVCKIDWHTRYAHMRVHSAGHVVHEAVMLLAPHLKPLKGEHGSRPYIEYQGTVPIDKLYAIEAKANEIVKKNLPLKTEFVTYKDLVARASYVPKHLPKNKPLRILEIAGFKPIPDGGTQVSRTGKIGSVTIEKIEDAEDSVRIYYSIPFETRSDTQETVKIHANEFIGLLLETQKEILEEIQESKLSTEDLRLKLLGSKSNFAKRIKDIRYLPQSERQQVGVVINEIKQNIEEALNEKAKEVSSIGKVEFFDPTIPGELPPMGHLHLVSQAIEEITRIFERISFTRVRHPEVDWDWYAFESLNMPQNHPARDEWETFFIETKNVELRTKNKKYTNIVLTPHTSNGQVREMEKGKLPIRMINIAKCYRRQSDLSHTPMFHQFEGLYVDKNVSIGHLKGVMDYFFKQYYGPDRESRIRPFHFQFTEPSFEVDITCGACLGRGCKLCKDGWLELGGAGMVHPTVLKNGGIDPNEYNGFAFGWGIERVAMMKAGTKLDDLRIMYSNDVRFLEQF